MPLAAEEAREIFTITTPLGMFTPTRVPQGVLNARSYFQAIMTERLDGIKCKSGSMFSSMLILKMSF